jgi:YVTN family beta-propeller protein
MTQQQFDDARDQGRWMDILRECFVYDTFNQKPILRTALATLAATFGSAARGVNFDATVANILALVAAGTDSDIDIRLTGKGTGGAVIDKLAKPIKYGRVYQPHLMAQGWVGKVASDINAANTELAILPSGLLYATSGTSVRVINPIKGTVLSTITVGSGAQGGAYCPTNDRFYVCCSTAGTVEVIDASTNLHTGTVITLAAGASYAVYCPSNDRIYVSNLTTGDIKVINPSTNGVVATIASQTGARRMTYCPSTDRIYAAVTAGAAVINPSTNGVVTTVTLNSTPSGVCYSPRNDRVYVSNAGSANVSVIDPSTNTVVATITVGTIPAVVLFSPIHGWVYVMNNSSNTVSVINPTTNTVLQTVTVNTGPTGGAYSPHDGLVYVGNNTSGNISTLA